jgi:hypothetical protein
VTRETLPQAAAADARLARHHDLQPGESITGTVDRLPEHGAYRGNSLLLRLGDGELVALEATAKRGFYVLEREIEQQAIQPGSRVRISFLGWREARSGTHSYRNIRVENLRRPA